MANQTIASISFNESARTDPDFGAVYKVPVEISFRARLTSAHDIESYFSIAL